jgi:hypothetical protein
MQLPSATKDCRCRGSNWQANPQEKRKVSHKQNKKDLIATPKRAFAPKESYRLLFSSAQDSFSAQATQPEQRLQMLLHRTDFSLIEANKKLATPQQNLQGYLKHCEPCRHSRGCREAEEWYVDSGNRGYGVERVLAVAADRGKGPWNSWSDTEDCRLDWKCQEWDWEAVGVDWCSVQEGSPKGCVIPVWLGSQCEVGFVECWQASGLLCGFMQAQFRQDIERGAKGAVGLVS